MIEDRYTIYKVENKLNGKVYIGQTSHRLNKRITGHYNATKRGSLYRFHQALKKYDKEVFNWIILEENISRCDAIKKEIYYISFYDSTNINKGYNLSIGGNLLNNEARNKIRQQRIGHVVDDKTRNKISNTLKDYYKDKNGTLFGVKMSDETKKKLSNTQKERLEIKENHPMYNKKHTEEAKLKMSESSNNKGVYNPMYGRTGVLNKQSKKYLITTPNNEKFIVVGLNQFCIKNNLTTTLMSKVAKNKTKQHKGYKCEYYYEDII